MPIYLVEQYGGWKGRECIDHFLHFATFVFERWGHLVEYWLPFNEINAGYFSPYNGVGLLKGENGYQLSDVFQALHHQFVASAKTIQLARKMNLPGRFGSMIACFCYYPLTSKPEDNLKLVFEEQMNQWYCMDILSKGEYPYYAETFFKNKNIVLQITEEDRKLLKENKFLSNIRSTSAICQVVRCFDDDNITHVDGSVDPLRDIDVINTELIFADIETIDKAIEKHEKLARNKIKESVELMSVLPKVKKHLEEFKLLKILDLTDDEKQILKNYQLLTLKPMIFAANVAEDDLGTGNKYVNLVREFAKGIGSEVVVVSAKVESELQEMDEESKKEFLEALGVKEAGLNRLIRAGFKLLGLQTYFTAGPKEVRAWTIKIGDTAPKAAGEIHTDFEKGFIRAKVVSYDNFIKNSGWKMSQENGVLRLEGKDYVVQDGDLMEFLFNV